MTVKRILIGFGSIALVGVFALLALFSGAGAAHAQAGVTPTTTPTTKAHSGAGTHTGKQRGAGPAFGGWAEATVKSISGATLDLTSKNGAKEFQVNTDANTIFIKNGFASISNIAVGDTVYVVRGKQAKAATASATPSATTAKPIPTAELVVVAGENDTVRLGVVNSVEGNTLTIRDAQHKTVMINTLDQASYKKVTAAGQAPVAATQSDVTKGSRVVIFGQKATSPAAGVNAKAVVILPQAVHAPKTTPTTNN